MVDLENVDPATAVVVATGNAHKLAEIEAILAPVLPGVEFYALGDLGDFPEPEENGATFLENALIKAFAAMEETGLTAIADDSGLQVDALGGEPGVLSARYAGVHGDDAANNALLLEKLADVPEAERTARFHSCVVMVTPEGMVLQGEGDCEGVVGFAGRGSNGFGYDPLFLPDDAPGRTMAELEPAEKNAISHRFHALEELARVLSE
jgi:XTP/dITP diphosphohydrolase